LGGAYESLDVMHLSGRVFHFSIISKAVGFLIQRKFSYECDYFKCYFHLWGSGGPNWIREESAWIKEMDQEWNIVTRKKSSSFPHGSKLQWRRVTPQLMDRPSSSSWCTSLIASGSSISTPVCNFVEESRSTQKSADLDRRSSLHDQRKSVGGATPISNRSSSEQHNAAQCDSPSRSPLIAIAGNIKSQGYSL
jgi:hypothetical protein